MNKKYKLFLAERLEGQPTSQLVGLYQGVLEQGSTLFTDALADIHFDAFEFTDDVAACDYILIPTGIRTLDAATRNYLDRVRAHAKAAGKKIIVFPAGDLGHRLYIDDMIVIKGSVFRYLMRPNEIIIPPYAEDMGAAFGVVERHKGEKPVVGFCGWAGLPTWRTALKYHVQNIALSIVSSIPGLAHVEAHKRGLYWRRKSMRLLKKDPRIVPNFIARRTFSGSVKTISLSPEQARKEYAQNFIDSDFALCPRGDANASIRLYEALSMGRVPILIDTECPLPLEAVLNYDEFLLKVPHTTIGCIGDILVEYFNKLTDEQFIAMQHAARKAYTDYLRYDRMFDHLFADGIIDRAAASLESTNRAAK
jgi:hypothetical protein